MNSEVTCEIIKSTIADSSLSNKQCGVGRPSYISDSVSYLKRTKFYIDLTIWHLICLFVSSFICPMIALVSTFLTNKGNFLVSFWAPCPLDHSIGDNTQYAGTLFGILSDNPMRYLWILLAIVLCTYVGTLGLLGFVHTTCGLVYWVEFWLQPRSLKICTFLVVTPRIVCCYYFRRFWF